MRYIQLRHQIDLSFKLKIQVEDYLGKVIGKLVCLIVTVFREWWVKRPDGSFLGIFRIGIILAVSMSDN